MKLQSSAIVRTVASATLVAALTLGAHAFVPAAFGCGAQQGGTTCREASDSESYTMLLAQVRTFVDAFGVLLP